MSGVYIPGMEIPKEPGAHKIRLFVREDGAASIWGLEEYIPHEPLEVFPVPDHGRLIDADAEETIVHCKKEENATFIAMILDADAEGKVWALDFYDNHIEQPKQEG